MVDARRFIGGAAAVVGVFQLSERKKNVLIPKFEKPRASVIEISILTISPSFSYVSVMFSMVFKLDFYHKRAQGYQFILVTRSRSNSDNAFRKRQ